MKKILINATGASTGWIGGLYYKKNILFSLTQNDFIMKNYKIYIVTEAQISEFDSFDDRVIIKKFAPRYRRFKIFLFCIIYQINYIYHCSDFCGVGDKLFNLFRICIISWIPDFQHKHYPGFFDAKEIKRRDKQFKEIAESRRPLILSSKDCHKDFLRYYSNNKKSVYVVPFVSYIEENIKAISEKQEALILNKYKLNIPYICVMNQFWQHKNHIIVLEAMREYYIKNPRSNYKFVFTGKLEDYRAPEYINTVKKLFEEDIIKQHSILLGFIDRNEQIVIMKNAEYIIQPSLFEGWGTVVEDAKILDKTILLSDIPVHREQMNHKCILFDPYNAESLEKLIEDENKKEHHDDLKVGLVNMHERAKEYSKAFEHMLRNEEPTRH